MKYGGLIRKFHFRRVFALLTVLIVILFAFSPSAFAVVEGSPHDFSDTGPQTQDAGIAPIGPCSGCHIPHNSVDNYVLWPRDLSDERGKLDTDGTGGDPNYVHGPTVSCYDCHDDHSNGSLDDDPAVNLFKNANRPQDIAFGMTGGTPGSGNWTADPPGGTEAGFYENDPPGPAVNFGVYTDILTHTEDTGGHYFKTADPATSTKFDQFDKLPCRDCHDPHNWDNQAFIKATLAVGKPTLSGVRASTNMSNPLPSGTRNDADSRDMCTTCHGTASPGPTPVSFNQINPEYNNSALILRPPSGIAEHDPTSTVACTDCHDHNSIDLSCTSCHGSTTSGQIWPNGVADNPRRVIYADDQSGAHDNHVRAIGIHLGYGDYTVDGMYVFGEQVTICSFCHPNPGGGGHDTDSGDQRVDVFQDSDDTTPPPGSYNDVFRKFDGAQSHTEDVNGTPGDQAYVYGLPTEGTCQNLVCHNQADTPFWNTPPDWSGAGTGADPNCSTTTCHDTGTYTNCHVIHADPANMGYDCKECHLDHGTNLGHQNGRVNMDFTTAGTIEGDSGTGDGFYDKSDAAANDEVHDAGDDEFTYKDGTNEKNCLAVFCHGGDSGLGGTSPMWTDATGSPPPEPSLCGNCHDTDDIDSTPATWLTTGKHTTHLDDPASPAFGPKAFCDDCHQLTLINPSDPATRKNTDSVHVDGLVSFADGNGVNQGQISGDTTVTSCDGCHGNDSGGGNIESRLAKFYWPDLDPRDGVTPQPSGTWFGSGETIDALLGNGDPRQAGGTTYCLNCHDSTPSTINTAAGTGGNPQTAPDKGSTFATSGHGLDTGSTYSPSGRTGAGAGCGDCHNETLAHISNTSVSGDTDRLDTTGNGLCAGCHDGTADGPGGKSEAQVSTHANTSTTMSYSAQESAMELNCVECHDVHGTASNIYMVNEVNPDGPLVPTRLYGGASDTSTYLFSGTVAFTANGSGFDYATAGVGDTTKICQTCHTQTGHYQNNSDDGHFTTKCTGCHFHDFDANFTATSQDGFMPSGCNGCHTYPGLTGTVTNPNLHRLSPASHDVHVGVPSDEAPVTNKGFTCSRCHNGSDHNSAGIAGPTQWSSVNVDTDVQVRFDALNPVAEGNNPGDTTQDSTSYDDTTNVCSNLHCHGATFASVSGNNTTPDWDLSTTGDCGQCHDTGLLDVTAATHISTGNHTDHLTAAYGPGFGAEGCSNCHVAYVLDAVTHVDGAVQFANIDTTTDAYSVLGLTAPVGPPDGTSTDRCNNCHSTATVNASVGTVEAKTNWANDAFSLDCLYCHNGVLAGNSAADGTGSYAPDINTYWAAGGHGDQLSIDNGATTIDSGGIDQVPPVRCEVCHDISVSHLPPPAGNPWRLLATATNYGAGGGLDSFCASQCHITDVPADHTYNSAYPSLGDKEPPPAGQSDTHPVSIDFTAVSTRWYQVPGEELPLFGDLTAWPTPNLDTHAFLCVTCHDPHGTGATDLTGVPPAQGTRSLAGQNTESVDKQMTRFNYNGQPTPLCVKCHM